MTDQEVQPNRGLPIWMPLAGMVVAFAFLVYAGTQIFPTLLGLVFPPEPPVPPDNATMISHNQIGPGADEWQYSSALTGCEIAKYVQDRVGGCIYDPSSQCTPDTMMPGPTEGTAYPVAKCVAIQGSGVASYRWLIQITTGHTPTDAKTRMRIYREATNRQQ
ncbi:MAG: hypothetical protein KF726_12690 [Anaerolineae bacterium]|nr:hypothetical protein [Anaerolineae bacterium]